MLPNRLSHSRLRPSLQKTSRSTARGFFLTLHKQPFFTGAIRPIFSHSASSSSHTATRPFFTYCASSSSSFIDRCTGSFADEPYRRGLKKASSRRSDSYGDFLHGRLMAAIAAKEIQSVITLPLRTKLVKLPFGQ